MDIDAVEREAESPVGDLEGGASADVVRPSSPRPRMRPSLVLLSVACVLTSGVAVLGFVLREVDLEEAAQVAEVERAEGVEEGQRAGSSAAESSLRAEFDEQMAAATRSAWNAGAEAAYPSGVADGQSAGYDEGYAAGAADGYADGLDEGYADGFADGVGTEPEMTTEERIAEYNRVLMCAVGLQTWNC